MPAEDRARMSIMLTSTDMKRSVRFYRDLLGFELKESWPDPQSPQWANMLLHQQSLMLGAALDPERVGEMCHGDAVAEKHWLKSAQEFRANRPGVGVQIYFTVPDIDGFCREIKKRGVTVEGEPKTEFYGIRDIGLNDPDGYRLVFFSPVSMSSCQSCGMPLAGAKPGQMYCQYCTDDKGALRTYEQVYRGMVDNYYVGMKGLARPEAENAARDHLKGMPAWAGHK